MKLGLKFLSAGVGLGTVGGASYATNYFITDNSIGKLLKGKGHTLLNFDTSNKDNLENWENIVRAYSNSSKKINNLTIATIQTSIKPTEKNINDLKSECKKIIKLNKQDDNNLKLAEQFCVTPITIKDLIKKSKVILDSTDGEKNPWDEKIKDYLLASTEQKITSVNLTDSSLSSTEAKRQALKKACDTIGAKKTHDNDYHQEIAKFQIWCSSPK